MAEYTKEDKENFKRKDRQQAKGFAVTQAIEILTARLNVEDVLKIADRVAEHTAGELLSEPAANTETQKKPVGRPPKKSSEMSAKAEAVFAALVKEYAKVGEVDVEKLKAEVLKLKGRYPTNLKSVSAVLKAVKPETVIKEN